MPFESRIPVACKGEFMINMRHFQQMKLLSLCSIYVIVVKRKDCFSIEKRAANS